MIFKHTWIAVLVFAAGIAFIVSPARGQPSKPPLKNSCIKCHNLMGGKLKAPVEKMRNDRHAEVGLSCADCHGGDPTTLDIMAAKSKAKGFRGAPKPVEIPGFCGTCHGHLEYMRKFNPSMPVGQLSAYITSVHGMKLAKGDIKVATCVSCHGSHSVLQSSKISSPTYPANVAKTCGKCHSDNEYMKDYKIPTDQWRNYQASVHGNLLMVKRDLSAPTCNDCHGNHGAYPPNVNNVSDMCGQCHVNNRELFVKSSHKKAFERLRLPECAICHSNHKVLRATDSMIGDNPTAVCVRCHAKGSPQLQRAVTMRRSIEDLKSAIQKTGEKLKEARRLGMEVSEASFTMKNARISLIKTRTQVHSFSFSEVEWEAVKGKKIADEALGVALSVIEEFKGRRRWVFLPIFLTLYLLGVIYMKIRQIEK